MNGVDQLCWFSRGRERVIDLTECAVAAFNVALLGSLRSWTANALAGKADDIRITETDNGFDLLILAKSNRTPDQQFCNNPQHSPPSTGSNEFLGPTVLLSNRSSSHPRSVSGAPLSRCPNGISASREGENKSVVRNGVQGAKRIADLYAGCGTLSFRLLRRRKQRRRIDEHLVSAMRRAAAGSHTATPRSRSKSIDERKPEI